MAVPGAPTALMPSAGNGMAYLEWTPPVSDGGAYIQKYTVTASPGTVTVDVWGFPGTTFPPKPYAVIGGLTNGTEYQFTITATNVDGEGEASGSSQAITPALRPGQLPNVVDQFAAQVWQDFADNGLRPAPEFQFGRQFMAPNSDSLRIVIVPKGGPWTGSAHGGGHETPDELARRSVRCDLACWGWYPDAGDALRGIGNAIGAAEQLMTRLYASMRSIATSCVWDGVERWTDDANLNRGAVVTLSVAFKMPAPDYTPVMADVTSLPQTTEIEPLI